MSKTPNVFPIVGGRKVEHLKDNIQALTIKLSTEQIKKLEEASPFTPGFPMNVSKSPVSSFGLYHFVFLSRNLEDLDKADADV